MKKYIIGFAVLIVISIFLVGCGTTTKIYPPQGQQATGSPTTSTPSAGATSTPAATTSGASASQQAPETTSAPSASESTISEIKMCESVYSIGWIPDSCEMSGDSLKIKLKAVGQNGINGMVFYVTGVNKVRKVFQDDAKASYNGVAEYTFSIAELESKVGSKIEDMEALPVKTVDGKDNACYNQRLLIIKDEACRS